MDFSKIDTKRDEEEGARLHLRHPQLGHLLYTGPGASTHGELEDKDLEHEAVAVWVRGTESPSVKRAAIKSRKKNIAKSGVLDEETGEQIAYDFVISMVTKIEGVRDGDRVITTDYDDLLWFFKRSNNIVRQVADFAKTPENFFRSKASS